MDYFFLLIFMISVACLGWIVLALVGVNKGPVLAKFQQYGPDHPYYFPLPAMIFWLGLIVFTGGLLLRDTVVRGSAIEVVGIRPGEKLNEVVFNVEEQVRPTRYAKIRRITRQPLDADALAAGLAALRECIAEGRSDDMADILWSTLRAGRSADAGGESGSTPPSTSKETSP